MPVKNTKYCTETMVENNSLNGHIHLSRNFHMDELMQHLLLWREFTIHLFNMMWQQFLNDIILTKLMMDACSFTYWIESIQLIVQISTMKRLPLDTARYDTRATLSCYSCSVQFHPLHVLLLPFKTLCALGCTAWGPSQSPLHCPQGCTAPPSPPLLPAPNTEHCSGPLKRPNPGPLVASLLSAQCSVLQVEHVFGQPL